MITAAVLVPLVIPLLNIALLCLITIDFFGEKEKTRIVTVITANIFRSQMLAYRYYYRL